MPQSLSAINDPQRRHLRDLRHIRSSSTTESTLPQSLGARRVPQRRRHRDRRPSLLCRSTVSEFSQRLPQPCVPKRRLHRLLFLMAAPTFPVCSCLQHALDSSSPRLLLPLLLLGMKPPPRPTRRRAWKWRELAASNHTARPSGGHEVASTIRFRERGSPSASPRCRRSSSLRLPVVKSLTQCIC